jgi:hypothetical protein
VLDVVDFPGPFGQQTERSRPRPFYCTQHEDKQYIYARDGFSFHTLPDFVILQVDRLFEPTQPNAWDWIGR